MRAPFIFENAPVAVLDIGTNDLVLDGVFGMNFLVASAAFDGINLGPLALGAFDFVVYDDQNAVLGFQSALQPVSVRLELAAGLNIASLPLQLQPSLTSHALGALAGSALLSVHHLDASTGAFVTTSFVNGVASGADFALTACAGYLLEVSVVFAGLAGVIEHDLVVGVNVLALHQTPEDFTTFKLLARIGDVSQISSVSRFNTTTGRYETANRSANGGAGVDFAIKAGEGYLVSMRQPVASVSAPVEGRLP